jgi:hypothetical protein
VKLSASDCRKLTARHNPTMGRICRKQHKIHQREADVLHIARRILLGDGYEALSTETIRGKATPKRQELICHCDMQCMGWDARLNLLIGQSY